jgi:large subunit ribosomal protein L22e
MLKGTDPHHLVPAADGVFDGADFEKFLHDHIKVDGKAGRLGGSVKISRNGEIVSL